MDNTLNLKVFILLLIERHGSLNNQYSLTRFFAKSSILPNELYDTLNYLELEDFIRLKEIINTVKYYTISNKGVQFVEKNYNKKDLLYFLHEVESTDFFTVILTQMVD